MVTADEKKKFLEQWLACLGTNGQTPELQNQLYELLMKDTANGKLYKYRSFDKKGYSIKSLKDGALYCASPAAFNDPFDCTVGITLSSLAQAIAGPVFAVMEDVLASLFDIIEEKTLYECGDDEQRILARLLSNDVLMNTLRKIRDADISEGQRIKVLKNNSFVVFDLLHPDAKNDYNHEAWVGTGRYCFWNEPIYGFYTTEDPWVLRKQAELLANAGVYVVFADNTNGGYTWRESYLVLYPTWEDAMKNGGVDVPKVSYVLPFGNHSGARSQANIIYNDIYKPGLYKDLWFYWDDKPMLMGLRNAVPDGDIGSEIKSFFTWRAGQPEYRVGETAAKTWGWLSVYPQALYSVKGPAGVRNGLVEQMSVGVAVNHNYVTKEITAMNGENVMGRSYTSDYPDRYEKEGASASLWGYQFAEQFNYALEVDPEVIFVTGWNEWHAWRQPDPWGGANSKVDNALVDQFDNEHSRDLEPTKGELKDHYYYQFVNFARQYKGVNPIPEPSLNATIDLGAGQAQWKNVVPYYEAYANNVGDRKSSGYGNLKYTETSGRNDLIGAQVARDDEYVYFNVECAEDITPYTDSLWMTLYIDCDQANQGWETFEYVINKSAASKDTVVLEKFTGEGYASTKVADCAYVVDGRYMTVKIAKSDLGLSGNDFTINFSWTDNVHDEGDYEKFSGDIMDFYISGDVAPGARFKYSYVSTHENATGEQPTSEEITTEPDTETEPVGSIQESTAETEPAAESGCKSVTVGAAMLAIVALGAIVIGKKKD